MDNKIETADLFILDMNISGYNGLDLCAYIKGSEKYKNVPVIMLSASPDIFVLSKHAGADDALAKPVSIKQLKEMVDQYAAD